MLSYLKNVPCTKLRSFGRAMIAWKNVNGRAHDILVAEPPWQQPLRRIGQYRTPDLMVLSPDVQMHHRPIRERFTANFALKRSIERGR